MRKHAGHNTPRSSTPGIVWPAVPSATGRQLLSLLFQFDLAQWASAGELRERQFRQLRLLASHAIATVPHYRDHFERSGIASVAEFSPETFTRWPILRKVDIQRQPDAFLSTATPPSHGSLHWVATSGSSGQPLRAVGTDLSVLFQHALQLRGHQWSGFDYALKLAVIRANTDEARFADWGPPANLAFGTGPMATMSVFQDHRAQLEWIRREAPAYLLAHNTNLRALIVASARYDLVPRDLRIVMGFADMPSPDLRQLAQEVWGARFFDNYSCSEIGTLALQCPQHTHMHVQSERVILEILRVDGSPCGPGETGRVVVTDLHNFAMPLIRYELGDQACFGESCPCGRGLPVLQQIVGRAGQLAVDPSGRSFFPHVNMEFWTTIAPILQRQIVQIAIDELEILYVADRDLTSAEMGELADAIRKALRYAYKIGFRRVTRIALGPGGKFDDFIALGGKRAATGA